jgi:antitoxin VapB
LSERHLENCIAIRYFALRPKSSAIMLTLPPETERLARLVAERSGKSPEDVLRQAVETQARVAGISIAGSAEPRGDIDLVRIREIVRRVAEQPLRDNRTPKDIRDQAWGEPG